MADPSGLLPEDVGVQLDALMPRLRRFFSSHGLAESADDLASETVLLVWQKIADGKKLDSVVGYGIGIARHLLARTIGQEKKQRERIDSNVDPNDVGIAAATAEEPDESDQAECGRRCLSELPPDQRELLVRYDGPVLDEDEESNRDRRARMARELDISPNALQQRKHASKARLNACIRRCMTGKGANPHSRKGSSS